MKGEVEMNPIHLNMLMGGVGGGGTGETGWGTLADGGIGKVPIETNRAIPTHDGARRADFAKLVRAREEQEKCTHLEQVEHFSESLPTS